MSKRTVSIRFDDDGRIKKISPHAGPEMRKLAKVMERGNLRKSNKVLSRTQFKSLMKVLLLAEQTCEHHEAEKHLATNPQYIEVRLLKACREARKALE